MNSEISEMIVSEITDGEKSLWDAFVRDSPQGSLFASSLWKNIIERATSSKQRIFAARKKDRILGGVVLTEKNQLGRQVALNALLSPYLGFLLPFSTSTKMSERLSGEHEALAALAAFLEKQYAQIDINNYSTLVDLRPFIERGWKAHPRYTYLLDVSDPEKLWAGFDGNIRQAIKKAEKAGFQHGIMECPSGEIFDLVQKTLTKGGGKNPIPKALIRDIVAAPDLKNRVIYGARKSDNKLVSVIVGVWDNRRAYYLVAANDPEFLSSGASSLLIWELAQHLAKLGIHELDFVGGNIQGISRFKEGFNPRLETFYRLERWTSLPFRAVKKAGQKLLGR